MSNPVNQVIEAWTVKGKNPAHHERAQNHLMDHWPVLADAICALVRNPPEDEVAAIEAKVRKELQGHECSELWGENGLLSSTMKCVSAITDIESVLCDDLTPEQSLSEIRRIMGIPEPTPPETKTLEYEAFCRDKISRGLPIDRYTDLPAMWMDELEENDEVEEGWANVASNTKVNLNQTHIDQSRQIRSDREVVITLIKEHDGTTYRPLQSNRDCDPCCCGDTTGWHKECVREWNRFWREEGCHGMSQSPPMTQKINAIWCQRYLLKHDPIYRFDHRDEDPPDISGIIEKYRNGR